MSLMRLINQELIKIFVFNLCYFSWTLYISELL